MKPLLCALAAAALLCGLSALSGGGRGARPLPVAAATGDEKEGETDREAIRASAKEFVKLFDKGDAKGLAAFWTTQGEYEDDSGEVVRGRAAIEEAFAKFFKENPKAKLEIQIEALRFPSRDCAVEEGLLRQSTSGAELPTSTLYSVVHVREEGKWKMALCREFGAGEDRLADLDWLVGQWQGSAKDAKLNIIFEKDKKKPYLTGHMSRTVKGKESTTGTIKVGFDAALGKIRAWHFEDDGGHGESLWIRDGKSWVMDAVGVLADGTEFQAVNLLTRLGPDEVTWRSIDRVVGDEALPDTLPIKLTRAGKVK